MTDPKRDCLQCDDYAGCKDKGLGIVSCGKHGGEAFGLLYCPACGSCGIGGCCGYFCDVCRSHHDEADEPRMRNLGGIPREKWQEPEAKP